MEDPTIISSGEILHTFAQLLGHTEEFLKIAVPAFVGLISGAVGSLIAPWVNWGIEKQRSKAEARRRFIADARAELQHNPDKEKFRESVLYSRLRPHLSERTSKEIESDTVTVQVSGRGAGADNYIPRVLDDILKLETKWDLL